ncbi:substrate-binding domain-containing protein [Aurantimonas aggregata]|uniref:Substrate-binding domain-containing protein n=1 Tax=Aurantimonas aggregata TaxID=2047720 RepID=A0A6L9MKE7_9HYPH|nr:substrate-binding domain-containing protein [Aurantimonas aggregata]NDV88241.1 substrate-binding domain-containing protein [Aurantimonas aggregata]
MGRSTIRDVAAAAGCSIATVSRVATGSGLVADAMRQRVVASALKLGFAIERRDSSARPVIGVLVPSLTNPVFASALAGIERCCRSRGVSTIIAQSHYDTAREEEVVATLVAERPRGLILTVCDPATSRVLGDVARQLLPAVTIYNGESLPGIGSVSVDNRGAMARIVAMLVGLGHRRVLFVGGRFASSDRSAARYAGYCDALAAVGAEPLPAFEVDFIDAAQDIDLASVIQKHRPSAIAASNDLLAVTVMASLRRMGLSVPGNVSVTGFDGIEITALMSPKLTTLGQPSLTMGVLAASMVLDIAAGRRRPESLTVDVTLVRGETIGPPAGADRAVPSIPHFATGAQ